MDLQIQLAKAIKNCETNSKILSELNFEHELLRFDAEGLNDADKDMLMSLLIANFGPKGSNRELPSDKTLMLTFESFNGAILAAIAIEKIRQGRLDCSK